MNYYFTSDHHFNHTKVIGYNNRPFKNLKDMHKKLITNWNSVVSNKDTVFVIGDFAMSKGVDKNKIINKLNGHKVFISGNHDPELILKACYVELFNKGFELVHNPADSSSKFVIHGHEHSKSGQQLKKTKKGMVHVNVNVEFWDYKPVSTAQIYKLLIDNNAMRPLQ